MSTRRSRVPVVAAIAVLVAACGNDERTSSASAVAMKPVIEGALEPDEESMFLGLRTVVYDVGDLGRAKEWYSDVLGFDPYFDEPFYVGFNVGGFELGLHPAEGGAAPGQGGTVVYWGVHDIQTAVSRLLELGATVHGEIQDVGEGIRVASVVDPFGNLLGVIENPHFELSAH